MSIRTTGTALLGAPLAVMLLALLVQRTAPAPSAGADGITVPAGFTEERVAGPPLVDRAVVAPFDDEVRLYVADSSGSNDKIEQQLARKPHRIIRLKDTNGDGAYDTSIVVADRMMFAAGANDLLGPYLGPGGWIYWTKGAFPEQTYERPGKPPVMTRAAHGFRRRPGDTFVEAVMSGGMDNPGRCRLHPEGERILTATFLEHPQLGRRDALVHALYRGLYGKPPPVLDGHGRTGDLLPELTHLGPSAPCERGCGAASLE